MLKETEAKKVLTYHDDPFPTNWDVNPYRGCTIGCVYCFAKYSHTYLGLKDFNKDIIVKTNVAECLHKQLSSRNWEKSQIKIGGTTDLYQHAEQKYKLIPNILKVVNKHRNPVFIQTKSTLILRDIDLIEKISKNSIIDIASSVSTLDEKKRKILEPLAAPTEERIKMLGKFKDKCRNTILCVMPIIPYITDDEENIERIFSLSAEHDIDYTITSFLHLSGIVKIDFMKMVSEHYPAIYDSIDELYFRSKKNENYFAQKKKMIILLKEKYNLKSNYTKFDKPKIKYFQTSLFE